MYERSEQRRVGKHQGAAAADEFKKILNHPCLPLNDVIAALALLGLARAYAISGDKSKSRVRARTSLPSGRTPTRHPNPEGSKGGARKAKVAGKVIPCCLTLQIVCAAIAPVQRQETSQRTGKVCAKLQDQEAKVP